MNGHEHAESLLVWTYIEYHKLHPALLNGGLRAAHKVCKAGEFVTHMCPHVASACHGTLIVHKSTQVLRRWRIQMPAQWFPHGLTELETLIATIAIRHYYLVKQPQAMWKEHAPP